MSRKAHHCKDSELQGGRDFVKVNSRLWTHCNRCHYAFKKMDNGEVNGKDVLEHKSRYCPLKTASSN